MGDPLVHYRLDGADLLLLSPITCPLPEVVSRVLIERGKDRPALHMKYPDLTFIDIGANVGDTVVLLRALGAGSPILCIEGDDRFFAILSKNLHGMR